jgi:hypothetical protein
VCKLIINDKLKQPEEETKTYAVALAAYNAALTI